MTRPAFSPDDASPTTIDDAATGGTTTGGAGDGTAGSGSAHGGDGESGRGLVGALRRVVAIGGGARMAWRLIGAALLGAGTEAAGVALMATATWLLVTAAGQPPITALTVAIVVVRALAIGRGGLRYAERLAGHDAVLRIVTEVRARIFARLIDRPLARNADALSRMVSDVDAVQDLVVRVAVPLVACGLVALIAVVVTCVFAPAAGLVLLVGLLVTGVAIPLLGARLTTDAAAHLAPLRAAYAVTTVDLVHGAADLAAYGATARYEAAGVAQAADLSTVERRLARRASALDALSGIVTGVTAAAVLIVARQQGAPPVWTAVLAIGTLALGELSLGTLAAARKAAEIRTALGRVRDLIDTAPAQPIDRLAGAAIVLRDVSVAGRLESVNLEITPGKRIAVVGRSGAGKSTLLGVIAGAIEPDSGTVTGAGAPYEVATGLLADAHLFHASARDNLLLGKPDATDRELLTAATVAGIGDFFAEYSADGVGEDGAEVSGGQRQRLALARAVLAAPKVLLLDEPTEGLDPAQAESVLEAVLTHAGDSAVVLVTHRFADRAAHLDHLGFDEIVVLEEGSVVGTVNQDAPTH